MIVYRIENDKGKGPFNCGGMWKLNLPEHVYQITPPEKEFGPKIWEKYIHTEYCFAWDSYNSVKYWLRVSGREALREHFYMVKYETEDFVVGNTGQVLFKKDTATLLKKEQL